MKIIIYYNNNYFEYYSFANIINSDLSNFDKCNAINLIYKYIYNIYIDNINDIYVYNKNRINMTINRLKKYNVKVKKDINNMNHYITSAYLIAFVSIDIFNELLETMNYKIMNVYLNNIFAYDILYIMETLYESIFKHDSLIYKYKKYINYVLFHNKIYILIQENCIRTINKCFFNKYLTLYYI